MPAPVNWTRWRLFRETVEQCLKEGFAPINVTSGKGSAIEEAQRRLIASGALASTQKRQSAMYHWILVQAKRAKRGLEHATPDWALYREPSGVTGYRNTSVTPARRWLLTAAQDGDDTELHLPFWRNLQAYAAHVGAQIMVGPFTYQKGLFEDHATRAGLYRPELQPFLVYERQECGPVLFCAEMNTLPTSANPLLALNTYSSGKWAVFPHAKRRLLTVPSAENPPVLMTTGCVTRENYVQRRAGMIAQFHHTIGAVIVEVDRDGDAHLRHISADHEGNFYDLDWCVRDGVVRHELGVECITYGDIQHPFVDPDVARATWGLDIETGKVEPSANTIVDALRPAYGVVHDLIDFKAISHHDIKRPSERQWAYERGHWRVRDCVTGAARFLNAASRDFSRLLAVESNHDCWLDRWLDDSRGLQEPQNRVAFHEYSLAKARAIEADAPNFSIWVHALRNAGVPLPHVQFIRESEGFVVCHESSPIQVGRHGHLGPNGGSSAPAALSRIPERMTIGDKHSPEIRDGVYVAGTSSLLRLRFNKGPSSWRHAHVLHYRNGRRTHLFIINGKWRA